MSLRTVVSMNIHRRIKLRCHLKRALHNLKVQPPGGRLDAIGPPDPVSNLRPIIFARPDDETHLEKTYREKREATQVWNQEFWSKHNASFVLERKNFQEAQKEAGVSSLTADEMSVFYKKFLDKNWRTHLDYNVSWYKKNFEILLLEIRVKLSRLGPK